MQVSQQPKALPYLFLTEMWERFGFYIVQGLLILYMTEHFGYSDTESFTILGVFTALAYLSPVVGGYLANRIIGYQTSIIVGGLFLILGYAGLSLPHAKTFLFPSLATIIIGNGLFKPNISSLLGTQYDLGDTRREAGFTWFYVGINIGAFMAGMSSGYIKEFFGWQASFLCACIGLVIGLLTFFISLKKIKNTQEELIVTKKTLLALLIGCVLAIVVINLVLHIYTLANVLLPVVGVCLLVFLAILTMLQQPAYRKKLLVLNLLIVLSVAFWMLFLQLFSASNLFVERLVDKDYFGFHLSTTVFWGSESVFIILLGPFFAMGWQSLGEANRNPSPTIKFALGLLFGGLGFLLLAIATFFPGQNGLINPLWVFASYLLITIGELLLSPIGLSAVTTFAPPNLVGLMMGVWFVAAGFGGIFAGMIAEIAAVPDTVTNVATKLAIYQHAFLIYACIGFFVAILLFVLQLFMKKLLRS